MANTFVKISTVTVGSGGAASIDFTSIPQTYTDLQILLSGRSAGDTGTAYGLVRFNNDSGANYTVRTLRGSGSAASSFTDASTTSIYRVAIVGSDYTASVFGNTAIYIPNYTSANYKSVSVDSVIENNATASVQHLIAGIWNDTAAITTIKIIGEANNLAQYSSATLYGIKSS
jgi:hypothetical protein